MSPVIYVSPAFRTACAEPRGAASPAASIRFAPRRLSAVRQTVRACSSCAQNGWCRHAHAHGPRLGSKTDIVLFCTSGFVKISSNQLIFDKQGVFSSIPPILLMIFHLRCLKRYSIM